VTLGTRRLIAGLALLLVGCLAFRLISQELFGSLFQSLLSLFAS
jgi:hypothetical protein